MGKHGTLAWEQKSKEFPYEWMANMYAAHKRRIGREVVRVARSVSPLPWDAWIVQWKEPYYE